MNATKPHLTTYLKQIAMLCILSAGIQGCDIKQEDVMPEDGFTKIYNHPEEVLSYYPESVLELTGGGYIFVSAVKDENAEIEYPTTYLVRTSATGEVEWTMTCDWLAPSSRLIKHGNSIGFVAMNQQFEAFVVLVDPNDGSVQSEIDLEITMPLYAYTDSDGNLLVLGYDYISRSSWISKYNANFDLQRSSKLPINTDLEYLIQRHLNKTGEDFHFFIGEYSNEAGTGYYVNCFYNYTLRTVFMDVSSLSATGDIYSFQIEEGISSFLPIAGQVFGLTSYYEGNNYLLPEAEIDVNSSQNIKDLPGIPLYELTFKASVVASKLSIQNEEYALYTSQTNSNSIVIYQHQVEPDSLLATHLHNFDQRVRVSEVIQTSDGGVAILGGIFILGKYPRPLLIKIPADPFLLNSAK